MLLPYIIMIIKVLNIFSRPTKKEKSITRFITDLNTIMDDSLLQLNYDKSRGLDIIVGKFNCLYSKVKNSPYAKLIKNTDEYKTILFPIVQVIAGKNQHQIKTLILVLYIIYVRIPHLKSGLYDLSKELDREFKKISTPLEIERGRLDNIYNNNYDVLHKVNRILIEYPELNNLSSDDCSEFNKCDDLNNRFKMKQLELEYYYRILKIKND